MQGTAFSARRKPGERKSSHEFRSTVAFSSPKVYDWSDLMVVSDDRISNWQVLTHIDFTSGQGRMMADFIPETPVLAKHMHKHMPDFGPRHRSCRGPGAPKPRRPPSPHRRGRAASRAAPQAALRPWLTRKKKGGAGRLRATRSPRAGRGETQKQKKWGGGQKSSRAAAWPGACPGEGRSQGHHCATGAKLSARSGLAAVL